MAKGTTVKMNDETEDEKEVSTPDEEVKDTTTVELDEPGEGEDTGDDEESFAGTTLADYPDEEEIWPGGPTVGHAKAWKEAYGRVVVGTLESGEHYMIRPLNRAEYRNHVINIERTRNAAGGGLQTAETLATEEAITMIGLLYPPKDEYELRNFGSAGFPTLASQQIMEISDFVAVETTELM
jgi:hypothetical protein